MNNEGFALNIGEFGPLAEGLSSAAIIRRFSFLKLDIGNCISCNYANFCKFFLKGKAVNNHRTQKELRSLDKAFLS